MEGGQWPRLGVNRFVPSFPCSSYRTADGWLGVLTPAQWKSFCQVLGRPDLAADPRFATTIERLLLADEIDREINPLLLERTTAEWVRAGHDGRVPLTIMPDLSELPGVRHWGERDSFAAFDGSGLAAAAQLQARGAPAAPILPVHVLGYHAQLADAGFWDELDRRFVGRHLIPAAPFAYDGRLPALRTPAPTLGEHTAEVLAELAAPA